MSEQRQFARLPFLLIVAVCLLQISWWVFFQYRESRRVQESELVKLEALCYRALVSVGQAIEDTEQPRALFERELQRPPFRDLEVAPTKGDRVQGVRVRTVLKNVDAAFGSAYVRPKSSAIEHVLDETRRTRLMFASEGIVFTLLILVGVALLYSAIRREIEMRRQHQSFLAGATHEMKTPLATIRLGLQTLERGTIDAQTARRYADQLVGQVDRLRAQIDNMLREASGAARRFNLLVGSLNDDVSEVEAEFAPRLDSRNVRLEINANDSVCVRRDREALQQVLRNLLDNALKYSPRGGTIRVSIAHDGNEAVLRIADDGPGISEQDRQHVFERFYRGGSQPDDARGGTGLGLFVSKEIIEAHGGTLVGKFAEDQGACFELRLPRARDPRETA